jgi:hypothetical protein
VSKPASGKTAPGAARESVGSARAASPADRGPRATARKGAGKRGRAAARETGAGQPSTPAAVSSGQAAARASSRENAAREPELPLEAFFDEEPDFRLPSAAQPPSSLDAVVRERAERASAAATHLHEQLKARWRADEEREAQQTHASSATAVEAPVDPLSPLVIRRFRRTIALSSPLPDPVRSLVMRARGN